MGPTMASRGWRIWVAAMLVAAFQPRASLQTFAEESAHQVLTALSTTTISGGSWSPVLFANGAPLAAVAGTWNIASFSTPNRLTMVRDQQGIVTDIPERSSFGNHTGSILVNAEGSYAGNVGDPVSGTGVLGENGVLQITTDDGGLAFRLNSAYDFMFSLKDQEQYQEVILGLRAPDAITAGEVAGTWTLQSFSTPARLDLQRQQNSSQIQNVSQAGSFKNFAGSMTILANGTLSGTAEGPFTGTFTLQAQGSGRVNVHVVPAGEPAGVDLVFFINASKDVMATIQSGTDFQEILVLTKAAASAPPVANLKGHWEIGSYSTPTGLTQQKTQQGLLTGILEAENFEAHLQFLNVGQNGGFTAVLDEVGAGTVTVTGSGGASVAGTKPSGETFQKSFAMNATANVLVSFSSEEQSQEIIVLTRAPATTATVQDLGLIFFRKPGQLEIYWAADPARLLQSSTDLKNWTDMPGTQGLGTVTISTPGTPPANVAYRVKQVPPP